MWIHKSLTTALGPVTDVSPRGMCLDVKMRDKCDTIRIKIINAHSPPLGIENDQIHDQFTVNLLRLFANIGDSESPGVGPFSEDRENNNGTKLRAFAADVHAAIYLESIMWSRAPP